MNGKKIPESVISRTFLYLRELAELSKANIHTISSAELGDRINLSDAQVRKDLGCFGQFGVSGSGYNTDELRASLEKILGKNKVWNVALVGVGHMGAALLSYPGFKEHGLNVVAAFDSGAKRIGKKISNIVVKSTNEMSKEIASKKVSIGIIAVPAKSAQEAADKLVEAGVACILNFAPAALSVPEDVRVKDVDLSRELETLSYFLAGKKNS